MKLKSEKDSNSLLVMCQGIGGGCCFDFGEVDNVVNQSQMGSGGLVAEKGEGLCERKEFGLFWEGI